MNTAASNRLQLQNLFGLCVLAIASPIVLAGGLPVIHVDASAAAGGDGASWGSAFADLQDALDAADAMGGTAQVWVASGIYTPGSGSTDRASTFELIDGIELYGGFAGGESSIEQRDPIANEAVLSGDLGTPGVSSDNAYHVVTFDDFLSHCVIDGFVVEHGAATGSGDDARGGGIFVKFASIDVRSCVFFANDAEESGGAIHAGTIAKAHVEDCLFLANSAQTGGAVHMTDGGSIEGSAFDGNSGDFGGALAVCCASVTISDTSFRNNFGNLGGAVFSSSADLLARRCDFFGNAAIQGGGAYLAGSGEKRLLSCRLGDNVANEGGAVWNSASLEMTNCQVVRNMSLTFGGGLFASAGNDLAMTNSTVVANECFFTGAGVYVGQGVAAIANSILWDNEDSNGKVESAQVRTTSLSSASVVYSNISGWEGQGEGNFEADPMFVDPIGADGVLGTADDNLALLPESPCVDRGDATLLPADGADLDGDGDPFEPVPVDLNMEARVLDDPGAPNAGAESSGGVDVGASEFQGPFECLSDINRDGAVDTEDLNALLIALANQIQFGGEHPEDINADGVVNSTDLNEFLIDFGSGC